MDIDKILDETIRSDECFNETYEIADGEFTREEAHKLFMRIIYRAVEVENEIKVIDDRRDKYDDLLLKYDEAFHALTRYLYKFLGPDLEDKAPGGKNATHWL